MYGYALLIFAAVLGFMGLPPVAIVAIALLLTIPSLSKHQDIASNYAALGPTRIVASAIAFTVVNNVFFAAMSFGLGRGVAWLLLA